MENGDGDDNKKSPKTPKNENIDKEKHNKNKSLAAVEKNISKFSDSDVDSGDEKSKGDLSRQQ